MRLNDFVGKKPDEVREILGDAGETARLDLLVDLVMRNRDAPRMRETCPGCDEGHSRNRSKFTDGGGRVWHGDCTSRALARVNPDRPRQKLY